MCSIFGYYGTTGHLTRHVIKQAQVRGRDSWGVRGWNATPHHSTTRDVAGDFAYPWRRWVIGNTRAEPTTEWVADKTADDIQPFTAGPLTVAHNGTIANDHDLATRYGVNIDAASKIDTARWVAAAQAANVNTPDAVLDFLTRDTIGSYAFAVGHDDGWLVLAANYRPIWLREHEGGSIEFTSVDPRHLGLRDRLREGWTMLDPYTALILRPDAAPEHRPLTQPTDDATSRALVVCSGGLDSTTAAAMTAATGPTDLLHLTYGCRAEDRELAAVHAIAEDLNIGLRTLDLTGVFAAIGNSRLTGTWDGAAAGEAGAEYAIEWVPARNTILLAVATGIAEGHGYSRLVLGNNIEEAGAYPDNEAEFVGRFNDLLPFAVADGRHVHVDQPLGGLTKREIVQAGLAIGAPLHLTWSCYDNGAAHCGNCGPCYMRRTAFDMLGVTDPMTYAAEAVA